MFKLKSNFQPSGDQPQAIEGLTKGINEGLDKQTLLGVTGSGKTFTIANVIEKVQKPTLIIAHNKTLAAQLCNEFRQFFPDNKVEYFVSYYDYYQPEAYMPRTDTYIEKEAQINDEIDRLRHAATQSVLSRKDVIIVSSVSCIYNLGSPKQYQKEVKHLRVGEEVDRTTLMRELINMQYERTNADVKRGSFRIHGDVLELMPVSDNSFIFRIILDDQKISQIFLLDPVTRRIQEESKDAWIFPARHYVVDKDTISRAIKSIESELEDRLTELEREGKVLEYERLKRRTNYDIQMIRNVGYCSGIENYSAQFEGRAPGSSPQTLMDYFPDDFLVVIDESHVTVPQVRGMYFGDKARKATLVDHGFRLPSAKDNRPLQFSEFEEKTAQTIYISATPGPYELDMSEKVVEQIVRPTGLVDPTITIKPVTEQKDGAPGQVDDLMERIKGRVQKNERTLVTTLTKKMAEDLSQYLEGEGVKVQYIHSDIKTFDRVEILTDLRRGTYDVVVGVNLLREGLDLPEVSLVAILDADKEGFLRSETSLVQTIGRAARNADGEVILYADKMTGSLTRAIEETDRRRDIQLAYNKKHGITPKTISKSIEDIREMLMSGESSQDIKDILKIEMTAEPHELKKVIKEKREEMKQASANLLFETAALLRDEIKVLEEELIKNKK
ncbi:excinuclease ABC subunit UvrB [Candidatus Uhrbacteria bacterium]|jgi:excinuclease ABC subunit B|nr:excinuclease ABC subunit UvrB [Candidatus Uhrbacteria bacterium]MBT7717597.1 excinuclease ABC subunit UvrB [Candidatus Uhrbacteria bacterium]